MAVARDEGQGISISSMKVSEIDQVVKIERLSFPTPWSPHAFYSELTENLCACYVVAKEGVRVIGYAGMWVLIDEAHVTNIAVHPDFRRRGIGEKLLKELITRAASRGARRLTLEVRPSNEAAQRLYTKFGFEPKGVRKGYYTDNREDAIIMWLEIDAGKMEQG